MRIWAKVGEWGSEVRLFPEKKHKTVNRACYFLFKGICLSFNCDYDFYLPSKSKVLLLLSRHQERDHSWFWVNYHIRIYHIIT